MFFCRLLGLAWLLALAQGQPDQLQSQTSAVFQNTTNPLQQPSVGWANTTTSIAAAPVPTTPSMIPGWQNGTSSSTTAASPVRITPGTSRVLPIGNNSTRPLTSASTPSSTPAIVETPRLSTALSHGNWTLSSTSPLTTSSGRAATGISVTPTSTIPAIVSPPAPSETITSRTVPPAPPSLSPSLSLSSEAPRPPVPTTSVPIVASTGNFTAPVPPSMPASRPPASTPTTTSDPDKWTVPWVGPPGGTRPLPLPTWTYTEQPDTTFTETPTDATFLTLTGVTYTSPIWITTTSPGGNDPTVVPIILLTSRKKPDDDGLEPMPVPIPVICFGCVPKVELPKIEIKTPQFCIRIFGLKIGNCPPDSEKKPGGGGGGGDKPPEDDPEPTKSAESKSKETTTATSTTSTSSCTATTTISPHCDQHCFVSPVSTTGSSTSFTTACNTATCRPTVVCSTTVDKTTTTTTFTTHSATPTSVEEFCGDPDSSCVNCAGKPDGGKALAARQIPYIEWNPQPDPELLENPRGLTHPDTWPGGKQDWFNRMFQYVFHYCDGLTAPRLLDDETIQSVGYSTMHHDVFADKALAGSTGPFWGCSGLLIITKRGIYTSHLWEVPNFIYGSMNSAQINVTTEFQKGVLDFLEGGSDDQNIRYLGVNQLKRETPIFDNLEQDTLKVIIIMSSATRFDFSIRLPWDYIQREGGGPNYPTQIERWKDKIAQLGFPRDKITHSLYNKNPKYWANFRDGRPPTHMTGYVPPDNLLVWHYHPAHVVGVVDGVEIVKPMIRVWWEEDVIYEASWCPEGGVQSRDEGGGGSCPMPAAPGRASSAAAASSEGWGSTAFSAPPGSLVGRTSSSDDSLGSIGNVTRSAGASKTATTTGPGSSSRPASMSGSATSVTTTSSRSSLPTSTKLTTSTKPTSTKPTSTKPTTSTRKSSSVAPSSSKPAPTTRPPLVPAMVHIFLTKWPDSKTWAGRFDMFAEENTKGGRFDVCSSPVLGYVMQDKRRPPPFPPPMKVWRKGVKIFGREECKYTPKGMHMDPGKLTCKGLAAVDCRLSTRAPVSCWQGESTFVPMVECPVPSK